MESEIFMFSLELRGRQTTTQLPFAFFDGKMFDELFPGPGNYSCCVYEGSGTDL